MAGPTRSYYRHGKRRKRLTLYRYVNVREPDWYNIHRLADKFSMSIVDLMALLINTNLEAQGMKPFTAEDQARLSEGAANS